MEGKSVPAPRFYACPEKGARSMAERKIRRAVDTDVVIRIGALSFPGTLDVPVGAEGLAVFAHGSGSSRLSPRNIFVAQSLQGEGVGTLLFDLLTEREDLAYRTRFDIDLITERLIGATRWLMARPETRDLPLGYFGASTGAAAALRAAAVMKPEVKAVVSRGGRPDLAMDALPDVEAPTLLIVGGRDEVVLRMNEDALARLGGVKDLAIVPGATHLFEEPGTLEEVARVAGEWFRRYLAR
jgi:putative phosphoribosyl transferase